MGSLGTITKAVVGVAVMVGLIISGPPCRVAGPPIGGVFDGLAGDTVTRIVGIGVLVGMGTFVGLIFENTVGVGENNIGVAVGRL